MYISTYESGVQAKKVKGYATCMHVSFSFTLQQSNVRTQAGLLLLHTATKNNDKSQVRAAE